MEKTILILMGSLVFIGLAAFIFTLRADSKRRSGYYRGVNSGNSFIPEQIKNELFAYEMQVKVFKEAISLAIESLNLSRKIRTEIESLVQQLENNNKIKSTDLLVIREMRPDVVDLIRELDEVLQNNADVFLEGIIGVIKKMNLSLIDLKQIIDDIQTAEIQVLSSGQLLNKMLEGSKASHALITGCHGNLVKHLKAQFTEFNGEAHIEKSGNVIS